MLMIINDYMSCGPLVRMAWLHVLVLVTPVDDGVDLGMIIGRLDIVNYVDTYSHNTHTRNVIWNHKKILSALFTL